MTPSRQQLQRPWLVFIFLSAQLKIMTKVNIWDQVYFGQTKNPACFLKLGSLWDARGLGHPAGEVCLGVILFSSLLLLPRKDVHFNVPSCLPRVQTPDWWWEDSSQLLW